MSVLIVGSGNVDLVSQVERIPSLLVGRAGAVPAIPTREEIDDFHAHH